MYSTQKRVWKMLRNRRADIKDTVQIIPINKGEWLAYFKNFTKIMITCKVYRPQE